MRARRPGAVNRSESARHGDGNADRRDDEPVHDCRMRLSAAYQWERALRQRAIHNGYRTCDLNGATAGRRQQSGDLRSYRHAADNCLNADPRDRDVTR